jgi:transposase
LFEQAGASFVSLLKKSILWKRRYSHKIDKAAGVRSDQTIILTGKDTPGYYPQPLRRIHFYSEERDKHLNFITNNFDLPAAIIAMLYKMRWKIELFFKWIKQNLRIKTFFGYNENAVKTQVWIAVCAYLIVAIIKKEQKILRPMSEILQVLSILQFEKRPISELFTAFDFDSPEGGFANQLPLFDL